LITLTVKTSALYSVKISLTATHACLPFLLLPCTPEQCLTLLNNNPLGSWRLYSWFMCYLWIWIGILAAVYGRF